MVCGRGGAWGGEKRSALVLSAVWSYFCRQFVLYSFFRKEKRRETRFLLKMAAAATLSSASGILSLLDESDVELQVRLAVSLPKLCLG